MGVYCFAYMQTVCLEKKVRQCSLCQVFVSGDSSFVSLFPSFFLFEKII